MENRSGLIAKRLWNVLRISLLMIRKGLVSKRKLIMDMNLMMKRGKLLRKSLSNLMSLSHHHHSNKTALYGHGFGMREYEFSCSNSPANPVFCRVPKRKNHYHFPCINLPHVIEEEVEEEEEKSFALVSKTPDYTFNLQPDSAASEKPSPFLLSPFSVRVSNYSCEEEEEENVNDGGRQVDREAEEFIRRFYEQLRVQSRLQMLQN